MEQPPKVPARIEQPNRIRALHIEVMDMLKADNPDFHAFLGSIDELVANATIDELRVVSNELKSVHKKIGGDGFFGKDIIDKKIDRAAIFSSLIMGGSFAYFLYSALKNDQQGMQVGMVGVGIGGWAALISTVKNWVTRNKVPPDVVRHRRMAVQLLGELVESRIQSLEKDTASTVARNANDPYDLDAPRITQSNEKPFKME